MYMYVYNVPGILSSPPLLFLPTSTSLPPSSPLFPPTVSPSFPPSLLLSLPPPLSLPPSQVLLEHTKSEVFDMVKALDLPLTHGDTALLKKLQALGLHSNRYTCIYIVINVQLD